MASSLEPNHLNNKRRSQRALFWLKTGRQTIKPRRSSLINPLKMDLGRLTHLLVNSGSTIRASIKLEMRVAKVRSKELKSVEISPIRITRASNRKFLPQTCRPTGYSARTDTNSKPINWSTAIQVQAQSRVKLRLKGYHQTLTLLIAK